MRGPCGGVADNGEPVSDERFDFVWLSSIEENWGTCVESNRLGQLQIAHADTARVGPDQELASLEFSERDGEGWSGVASVGVPFCCVASIEADGGPGKGFPSCGHNAVDPFVQEPHKARVCFGELRDEGSALACTRPKVSLLTDCR